VAGALTLLEAMRDAGIGQIVFSSTCATYGVPRQVPLVEDHSQNPINPYGCSKFMVEQMLKDFYTAHQISSIALRYFNAAGADPDGQTGEDHDPETHLIPLVLDAAMGRRPDITVFGEDYDTPDGTCIRDYIHVSDLAQAHVLALNKLQNQKGHYAFNLGNGNGYSVKQVIDTAREVTGRDIRTTIGPRRPGDPDALVGDATRIQKALGWQPRFPDLKDIIETAWNWHRKHFAS